MKHFYLSFYLLAVGFLFTTLVACRSARQSSLPYIATIEGIRVIRTNSTLPKSNLIFPDTTMAKQTAMAEKEVAETNIEKGGKMTYMAPVWATKKTESGIDFYAEAQVLEQATALRQFALENAYDTGYAFLVNMSLKSGKKRFYVVNLQTMTIVNSGLAAHGRGEERFTFEKSFSNNPGSNCSSIGRYKIGKPYQGQFGLAYKLHGLDSTNNNAFKRFVVLHAMGCISYEETKLPICQSEGCPAVSPRFLEEIQPLIDSRKKPMLLWVFDSTSGSVSKM
jgi:L,D-transpeptidase catalytic domain